MPDTLRSFFPFASLDDRREAGDYAAWLYRYFDPAGRLLYVGFSKHPEIRDNQHWWDALSKVNAGGQHWRCTARSMRLDLFTGRLEAERAEALAIDLDRPLGNALAPGRWLADGDATAVPCGTRTHWASVAGYSAWWREPRTIPADAVTP